MTPYDASSGSVWEMPNGGYNACGTIIVVLDGYVAYNLYRHAFSITEGILLPFGKGSWIDVRSVRIG